MESNRRATQDGFEYDHLFPKAKVSEHTIKRGARLEDTMEFIPKVVRKTKWQTKKFAEWIKKDSLYETCKSIWEFIYPHVGYHKDDEGSEQIRSPARLWHDRQRGVDCDCFTVFISTVLTNLKIPHRLRITKYSQDHFQHIYPVVPAENGKEIIIDCVVKKFDHEEPYSQKKDTIMDLEYLDGTEENDLLSGEEALYGDEEMGKLFSGKFKEKLKKALKKVSLKNILNTVNRLNPATVLLRNGVLAAMKLNLFKVAQRIKWAYLTEDQAKAKGVDVGKWKALVKIREKLDNIFYGAGGKTENLKKAILTGKGNSNHEVNGLGFIPKGEVFEFTEATPLPQLIGAEIWHSENVEGMEEFEGLGELGVIAAASVTAASGAIAVIAQLIKKIGNIFPKKDEAGAEDFHNTEKEDAAAAEKVQSLPVNYNTDITSDNSSVETASVKSKSKKSKSGQNNSDDSSTDDSDGDKPQGFWDKNKKWLKPTLLGVGGLGVLAAGYHFVMGHKKTESASPPKTGLDGLKSKKKKKPPEKKAIALM